MPLPGQYSSGTIPKDSYWTPAEGAANVQTKAFPEAASQTFQARELVGLDASGNLINLGGLADPSAASVSASLGVVDRTDMVIGMVLSPASGTTGTNHDVILATDDVVFWLRTYAASATDAENQDTVIGDFAEIKRYNGAGDIQTVVTPAANATDGINKVQIVAKREGGSATDQYAIVGVKVRPAWQSLGGTKA